MQKPNSNTAARARAHCTSAFWNHLVVGGLPIEMYGEGWFVHFQVDIIIVLYYGGLGTSCIGEWRLNHIHSMNNVEVINKSLSVSSTEIDYRPTSYTQPLATCTCACPTCERLRQMADGICSLLLFHPIQGHYNSSP